MPASLVAIYRRFSKETAMLTRTLEASIASRHTHLTSQQSFVVELCVIRLHDAWSRFCRELVVTSAYAKPLTAQGNRVQRVPGVKRRDQVIPKLLATYPKRNKEPTTWYMPGDCLDIAKRIEVSNYSAIASGIGASFPGASPSPDEQVRRVRNFFAHRHQESASLALEIARSLNIPGITHPRSLVVATIPPGISVFGLWANRLRLMAYLSIQ